MLGIDFSELMVIAIVALIVIGPEHLPKVARTAGHLWGRLQRYVNSVKADMSREMALEELRKAQQQFQQAASDVQQTIHHAAQEADKQVKEAEAEVAVSSGFGLGQSIPQNELDKPILQNSELLKSEQPVQAAESQADQAASPRHVILEDEHHAVMPASLEQNKKQPS